MPIDSPPPLSRVPRTPTSSTNHSDWPFIGFCWKYPRYRHVYSQTGGAQYGRGSLSSRDLLIVYAEAFDRDSDSEDFSLTAIIAHECGHQLLARHPRIIKHITKPVSLSSEEILASLLGAIICQEAEDRDALLAKATVELVEHGEELTQAVQRLQELWDLLETLL